MVGCRALPVPRSRRWTAAAATFLVVGTCFAAVPPAGGQPSPASAQGAPAQSPTGQAADLNNLSPEELRTLVGRVALYPDDLLAIVLPASTQTLQIVEAQRLLDRRKSDPQAKPPVNWDPSVVALLNYPEVIQTLNADLAWTQQLGTSVVAQQPQLMDAIQSFRKAVMDAGNLKSNDKQTVTVQPALAAAPAANAPQTIVIAPADPQVIYVPSYQPATVVVAPPPQAPPPYAYSPPYAPYYSPAATFFTGAVFGAAIGYAIGWNNHDIYHGDVNVSNNVNINSNNTNAARISQNRENSWHPSSSAAQRARPAGGNGFANRPSSDQIRSGLAQRGGVAPGSQAGAGRFAGGGALGRNGGGVQAGGAARGPSAGRGGLAGGGAGRFQAQRPGAGGQGTSAFAGRGNSGAFSGINRGAATNRASARGASSLGGGAAAAHAAPAAGGARGGGGLHGGGGRRR